MASSIASNFFDASFAAGGVAAFASSTADCQAFFASSSSLAIWSISSAAFLALSSCSCCSAESMPLGRRLMTFGQRIEFFLTLVGSFGIFLVDLGNFDININV
ncbi:MAG: hypothetical protein PHQ27_00920 [Victivallales bacterium]|nr:hypothetical protein [Victivallales bacterium]